MVQNAVKKSLIYCISGYKNSGKTTVIDRLIPILRQQGYQVAVLKHDGHDFETDREGTDSWKHKEAGAYGTAVFSDKRFQVIKEYEHITERELVEFFPEADIILIEGFKDSVYPKYVCNYPETIPDVESLAKEIIALYESVETCEKEDCEKNI